MDGKKTNPGTETIDSFTWLVSADLYKMFNVKFREIKYTSDFGYVFADEQTQRFYSVEPLFVEVSIGQRGSEFTSIRLGNSVFSSNYYRKFGKFQELVAQIGGVMKFIFVVGSIINNYLSEKLLLVHIGISSYFEYKQESEIGIRDLNILSKDLKYSQLDQKRKPVEGQEEENSNNNKRTPIKNNINSIINNHIFQNQTHKEIAVSKFSHVGSQISNKDQR